MTLLRTGFFFSKPMWVPPTNNAAPTISSVTLNFDLRTNEAPVGDNVGLVFEVLPSNAAPSIAAITLNFDLVSNSPPVGQNQALVFEVAA